MRQEIDELIAYCHESYDRGFVGGTGGNLSIRIGDDMYITSTGSILGKITKEDIVRVPICEIKEEHETDFITPSKEAPLHLSVYRTREDLRALIHLHPVNVIAATLTLDSASDTLPVYVPSFLVKVGALPQVEYYRAGSKELCQHITERFKEANCVLMRRHGVITGGKSLKQAFAHIEDIEDNCRLHLLLHNKSAMTEDEIKDFQEALTKKCLADEMLMTL